jgi:hypothetical protein
VKLRVRLHGGLSISSVGNDVMDFSQELLPIQRHIRS